MKSTDNFKKPTGRLSLKIFKNGQMVHHLEGMNLIVNGGRDALAQALAGEPNKHINTFGAGGDPTAPVVSDTALTPPTGMLTIFSKAIDTATNPATGQVTFTFKMNDSEGNGATYQEWGLFCADGTLFSRKTTVPITKDSSISIEGEWSILIP